MKKKNKSILYRIFITVFLAIFIFSSYKVASYYIEAHKQKADFDKIAQVVDKVAAGYDEEQDTSDNNNKGGNVFESYAELALKNSDIAGWIFIEDTNINYPVMMSCDNPNFYLHHNFNKEYSDYGVPYIQENCSLKPQSDNVIIYSHNMKDGTMFADLLKYQDKEFYEKHKIIRFDTLNEEGRYEVLSVFKVSADLNNPDIFEYYNFVNAADEGEFLKFVEQCRNLSLYDTGVEISYEDKLLTLSTCEYSQDDGRFVVVARKI